MRTKKACRNSWNASTQIRLEDWQWQIRSIISLTLVLTKCLFIEKSPAWWKRLEQTNCGIYLGDKYLKTCFLWNLLCFFKTSGPFAKYAKSGFPWKKQSKNTITDCMKLTTVVVLSSFSGFLSICGKITVQICPQTWWYTRLLLSLLVNMNYVFFFHEHKCNVLFVSFLTVVPCLWLFCRATWISVVYGPPDKIIWCLGWDFLYSSKFTQTNPYLMLGFLRCRKLSFYFFFQPNSLSCRKNCENRSWEGWINTQEWFLLLSWTFWLVFCRNLHFTDSILCNQPELLTVLLLCGLCTVFFCAVLNVPPGVLTGTVCIFQGHSCGLQMHHRYQFGCHRSCDTFSQWWGLNTDNIKWL